MLRIQPQYPEKIDVEYKRDGEHVIPLGMGESLGNPIPMTFIEPVRMVAQGHEESKDVAFFNHAKSAPIVEEFKGHADPSAKRPSLKKSTSIKGIRVEGLNITKSKSLAFNIVESP